VVKKIGGVFSYFETFSKCTGQMDSG